MRTRALPRTAPKLLLAATLALALVVRAAPARAEMEYAGWVTGIAISLTAAVPMAAVAPSVGTNDAPVSRLGGGGLLAAGGSLALVGAIGLALAPRDQQYAASYAFGTFVEGQLWGVAGVGIGALAKPHTRLPWLGGSIGHGAAATYQGILSLAGQNDYVGTGASQAVLGVFGSAGCFLDMHFAAGTERWVGLGCGVVSAVAAVHGVVMAATARGRHPLRRAPRPRRRALVPVPWLQRDVAGVMLAGSF